MSRIAQTFARLRRKREGGLIAYVTAGDPDASGTVSIADILTGEGVDIIELGVPFSDPIADGPTIQAASVRALKAGTTPKSVFKIVESIREQTDKPIALMTYYNPIFRMGLTDFMETAKASGVDGVIVPDLPVEEASDYKRIAQSHGIDTMFLLAPSTSPDRIEKILDYASGFLYLVSVFGVTGSRSELPDSSLELVERTSSISKHRIPLAVGFGISKPEHVQKVLTRGADAAIVGSAFVNIIERMPGHEEETLEAIADYARQLKNATKLIS